MDATPEEGEAVSRRPLPPSDAKDALAKGLVLMEFHYPAGMLADWLREAEEGGVLKVRYRSSCGPFVSAKDVWLSEDTGYLVHDCVRHNIERVRVIV